MDMKKRVRWENVRGPKAILAVVIGTALGAGLAPVAPGTLGTLVGVPIHYFSADWSIAGRLTLWIGLTLIGIWAAQIFDRTMKSMDNQSIVIDEVVGFGITAWTAGTHVNSLIVAFVLFRILDIVKIPPVRQIDRWSKKRPGWSGFGVMADDVMAAFQGLAIMLILQYFGILPWA